MPASGTAARADTRPPSRIREAMNARCGARELLEETTMLERAAAPAAPAAMAGRRGQLPGHGFSPAMIAIAQKSWPPPRLPPCPSSPRRPRIRHAGRPVRRGAGVQLSAPGARSARHAAAHPRCWPTAACSSPRRCLGDMNPLIRLALLPAMRAIGKAPLPARSAPRRWSGRRRVRDPGDGTPRRRRQRPAAHGRAQALNTIRARPRTARRCRLVPR